MQQFPPQYQQQPEGGSPYGPQYQQQQQGGPYGPYGGGPYQQQPSYYSPAPFWANSQQPPWAVQPTAQQNTGSTGQTLYMSTTIASVVSDNLHSGAVDDAALTPDSARSYFIAILIFTLFALLIIIAFAAYILYKWHWLFDQNEPKPVELDEITTSNEPPANFSQRSNPSAAYEVESSNTSARSPPRSTESAFSAVAKMELKPPKRPGRNYNNRVIAS